MPDKCGLHPERANSVDKWLTPQIVSLTPPLTQRCQRVLVPPSFDLKLHQTESLAWHWYWECWLPHQSQLHLALQAALQMKVVGPSRPTQVHIWYIQLTATMLRCALSRSDLLHLLWKSNRKMPLLIVVLVTIYVHDIHNIAFQRIKDGGIVYMLCIVQHEGGRQVWLIKMRQLPSHAEQSSPDRLDRLGQQRPSLIWMEALWWASHLCLERFPHPTKRKTMYVTATPDWPIDLVYPESLALNPTNAQALVMLSA